MKLTGRAAVRFSARPDLGRIGALLYGPDAGVIDPHRRRLVAAISEGDELRLTRLDPAALRRDPAALADGLRARGFFPGRRAVLVEGAKDALAPLLSEATTGLTPEDAFLVVTAEGATTKSALVKLFEGHGDLVSIGLYPEPVTVEDVGDALRAAGLSVAVERAAEAALIGAAQDMDWGEFEQLAEKIAVFWMGRRDPLSAEAVAPLLPQSPGADLDQLASVVVGGAVARVGPLMGRLQTEGVAPATMLIAVARQLRQIASLISAPDGIEAALTRQRPPLRGPRARIVADMAQRWRPEGLEAAIRLVFAADRVLRSPGARPDRALVERCLIRVAMQAGRA